MVAQVAPAVRTAWGEELGLSRRRPPSAGSWTPLKRMGVDYAFDTVFSADLTIMEEASEFLERFTKRRIQRPSHVHLLLPRLDPVRKDPVPHMVKYLSTAKSPSRCSER